MRQLRGYRAIGAGVSLIVLQYLVLSMQSRAILLPEFGVVALAAMAPNFTALELLSVAAIYGYVSDVLGAAERGSLLIGYLVVAIVLGILSRYLKSVSLINALIRIFAALVVFHIAVAGIGGPVIIRQWLGIVVAQLLSGAVLVTADVWAQRKLRIGR